MSEMTTAPYLLETARLRLRQLTRDDAGFILELLNDASFIRNIGDKGVRSEYDAIRYISTGPTASYELHGFGLWAVELRSSGEPIGLCGLLKREELDDVDLGYAFLPAFRSIGYAAEAAEGVIDFARARLGLGRIVAITLPGNQSSIRVLEKNGFRFERTVRLTDDGDELSLYASNVAKK